MRIIDMHCDLLAYLAKGGDLMNREARCSLPQLKEGNVAFQVLAIFTETKKGSAASAAKQLECYRMLLEREDFVEWKGELHSTKIAVKPAIENASGLCEEGESLEHAFERLPPNSAYVSLTWNTENRFGGGNHTKVGLKREGELLLTFLSGKGIAIDLSHTSDQLASDIFEYIDKKGLQLTPIASHSNLRSIEKDPRNLPDEFAQEIFRRGGVIGLNMVRKFLPKKPPGGFLENVDKVRELGGISQVGFGADFFYDGTVAPMLHHLLPFFYKEFGDASCYPLLLEEVPTQEREMLAHKNLEAFFKKEAVCT
ncbi:MAG: membrane dipeptidase [Chlamydiales bacterium]|nr:membrane dipeptidase [Chlamydiales bacterium]